METAAEKTILHCDLNAFYASVECIANPQLHCVPMAVCGNPEARRGIILAKNELAKGFGVTTAETIWQAKTKCPDLVLVSPHHQQYAEYSKLVNAIYQQYSDRVEPFGIDESWIDVTHTMHLFGTGEEIADTIRSRIKNELGLTVSVGVSFNKVFAKLGSDYKKPDATTVISRENYRRIVWPLPVDNLLFVGKNSKKVLGRLGIQTIGQLAGFDKAALEAALGKAGGMIHDYANGKEDSPVAFAHQTEEVKSVGNGMTFKRNLLGADDIKTALIALSDSVSARLRRKELVATTLQVTLKNPDLKTITRQKPLKEPTNLAHELFTCAYEITSASWDFKNPIRMLTVTSSNLLPTAGTGQTSMFELESAAHLKQEKLQTAMDSIRKRYGKDAITFAPIIKNDLGIGPDQYDEDE